MSVEEPAIAAAEHRACYSLLVAMCSVSTEVGSPFESVAVVAAVGPRAAGPAEVVVVVVPIVGPKVAGPVEFAAVVAPIAAGTGDAGLAEVLVVVVPVAVGAGVVGHVAAVAGSRACIVVAAFAQ